MMFSETGKCFLSIDSDNENMSKTQSKIKPPMTKKSRCNETRVKRPKTFGPGKPTMPYKLHIQFDYTRFYVTNLR